MDECLLLLLLGMTKIQYVYIFHLFQWKVHYPVLSRLAVGQTLMVNQLVDMEWKFGGKQ